jgi:hypothetical protein
VLDLPDVVLWSIPAFVLLTLLEAISYRLHPDEDEVGYGTKDTATSLTMGLGSLGFDILWGLVRPRSAGLTTHSAGPP